MVNSDTVLGVWRAGRASRDWPAREVEIEIPESEDCG